MAKSFFVRGLYGGHRRVFWGWVLGFEPFEDEVRFADRDWEVGEIVDEDRGLFEGFVRGCLGCAVPGHWVEGNAMVSQK